MLFLSILLPFLAAISIAIASPPLKRMNVGWFVLVVPLILFGFFASQIPRIASGETVTFLLSWIPTYGIDFSFLLDGLSLIFVLLISGVGALVILYSIYYLSPTDSLPHFYTYLMLFMGAMLGVVLSDNLIVLYLFWELTSISSFLLIAFWFHRKNSRNGAQKSLLITMFGGFSMLAGFIMVHLMTDSFSIREILTSLPETTNHPLFYPAMACILLGAFTKSAQFPFHIWLPDAMEAPTPISAYLHSATMVKAGIYLVARLTPGFGGDAYWFWVITLVGLTTLFWGSFNAVRQNDLKALLAFSTISQLGLIMTLLGIGSATLHNGVANPELYALALFAALFHLVNHSTFKGSLFMVVGIIDHQVGTRDLRRLGGLIAFLPITFVLAIVGSFSMAGLPLLNGFLSKEMFFTAVLAVRELDLFSASSIGWLIVAVAWTASLFTFVYSMVLVFRTFTGNVTPEINERPPVEAPIGMLISPIVLGTLVIGLFFFPNLLGDSILKPALGTMVEDGASLAPKSIYAWHGFNTELWMTLGIIVLGTVAYYLLKKWRPYYQYIPSNWSFNNLFAWSMRTYEGLATSVTNRYMNGNLPTYFAYIFTFFILLIGGMWLTVGPIAISFSGDAEISLYETLLAITMAMAAVAILFAESRLTAILLNGVLGFSIAIFFVFFRAPDLALTQLVIEAVTTILFLVCFNYLPEWKPESLSVTKKIRNGLIAAGTGLMVVIVGLAVNSYNQFESISSFYEDSYELAGGRNIVNAILGDFRAFDTMLEGLVLFIAGIGVFTLIRMRQKRGAEPREDQ